MTHLAGFCNCGRKIHFPRNAVYGYTWTCWDCGMDWTLSDHGEPLHTMNSMAPPTGSETTIQIRSSIFSKDPGRFIAGIIMGAFIGATLGAFIPGITISVGAWSMGFIAFVLAVKDRLSTYEKIDKGKG